MQLCCHNDRAPEEPTPSLTFPNQPSSCSRQTVALILPQQDPELSPGFLLALEKKGEEAGGISHCFNCPGTFFLQQEEDSGSD